MYPHYLVTSDVTSDVASDVTQSKLCTMCSRIGDYPGQGEVSGMSHQGRRACHWCEGKWRKDPAFKRTCYDGHHRWLDAGDPLRKDDDVAPHARTPANIARAGKESEDSDCAYTDADHPRKESGVNHTSALSLLPMFNIVWDVTPDWMHIMKNLIMPHFLKVVKGKRKLTQPDYIKLPDGADERAGAERYSHACGALTCLH